MAAIEDFKPSSQALATLLGRGYVEQVSAPEALDAALAERPLTFYIGFDPTASSIHAGHLVQLMTMRVLQQAGHRPICLMGGGTARVGDPTGKSETRKLLDAEQIAANTASMARVFGRFLNFDSSAPNAAKMVDNADWLLGLNYVEFLRDIGRHFTVNRMIAAKTYRERLENEQALSFLEFNYQLLQAYDFLHLHRSEDVVLQCGGSDQWGNIIAGIELIRRVRHADGLEEKDDVFCLTTPLLTTSDGKKMGKTERGALFLDPDRVSPYDYYQYWINCDDRDVAKLMRLYTELPLDEIEAITAFEGRDLNPAKQKLAFEATSMAHGPEDARRAQAASNQAFGTGDDWSALPCIQLEESEIKLVDLVVHDLVKGFKSKREARQRIESGAVRIDGEPVIDPMQSITASNGGEDGVHLQVGKKSRYRIAFGGAS